LPVNVFEQIKVVEKCVEQSHLDAALDKLYELVKGHYFLRLKLLGIKAKLSRWKKDSLLGVHSHDQKNRYAAIITNDILELLRQFENKLRKKKSPIHSTQSKTVENMEAEQTAPATSSWKKIASKLLLGLGVPVILFLFSAPLQRCWCDKNRTKIIMPLKIVNNQENGLVSIIVQQDDCWNPSPDKQETNGDGNCDLLIKMPYGKHIGDCKDCEPNQQVHIKLTDRVSRKTITKIYKSKDFINEKYRVNRLSIPFN
jgi:hypothetical protein